MLCSGAAAGLAFAVPSKRFRAEAHSVPEGQGLSFAERVVRAAVGVGLGVVAGLGHKERAADFNCSLNLAIGILAPGWNVELPKSTDMMHHPVRHSLSGDHNNLIGILQASNRQSLKLSNV